MSDQDTKSYQANIRLNEVANMQLSDLNKKLNLDRSALIRMAIAELHRIHCPPSSSSRAEPGRAKG